MKIPQDLFLLHNVRGAIFGGNFMQIGVNFSAVFQTVTLYYTIGSKDLTASENPPDGLYCYYRKTSSEKIG
jgi:hypothetical protein